MIDLDVKIDNIQREIVAITTNNDVTLTVPGDRLVPDINQAEALDLQLELRRVLSEMMSLSYRVDTTEVLRQSLDLFNVQLVILREAANKLCSKKKHPFRTREPARRPYDRRRPYRRRGISKYDRSSSLEKQRTVYVVIQGQDS